MADPSIVRDPVWLAHRYVEGADAIQFRRLTRAEHRAATFITDEHLPPDGERIDVDRRTALAGAPAPAPVHFIFHSAFCCSTLVAQLFEREGLATALKEPVILNDVIGWRLRGASRRDAAELTDAALRLLARPFEPGEAVIIKPSNLVNGLIGMMMAMRPEARALLLYAPLRVYLTSIAKKGLDGRLWVRDLFVKLRKQGLTDRLGFDDEQFFGQTDLQIAAAGWLAQQALFAGLAETLGDRIRTLDSEDLLDRPHQAFEALAAVYGLPIEAAAIDAIVAANFSRNSKTGVAFGRAEREAEYAAAAASHRDEIEKVATWAETVAERMGIPVRLGAPLLA